MVRTSSQQSRVIRLACEAGCPTLGPPHSSSVLLVIVSPPSIPRASPLPPYPTLIFLMCVAWERRNTLDLAVADRLGRAARADQVSKGDLAGGATSAVLTVPVSMGYGVLALLPLVADTQYFRAVRRTGRGYALPIPGNFVTTHRRGAFVTAQEVTPSRTGMRLAHLSGHRTEIGHERIIRTCGVLALTRSTVAMWDSRSPGARGVAARVRRCTNADRRRDAPAWGAIG